MSDTDPLPSDTENRLALVAELLARGVLRLRDQEAEASPPGGLPDPKKLDEPPKDSLEVPLKTVLSVHKS